MKQPLFQHLDQLAADRWARQGLRTLLRAAWLAVCVWCIGLGGHLLWGWPLRLQVLAVLSLGIVGSGLILLLRPRLTPREVARRLDRRFHLDEQLSTAVEVARQRPDNGSVAAWLLAESSRTAALVHRRIDRRQSMPWSEVIALAALCLVVVGLLVLSGIGPLDQRLIGAAAAPLPPLAQPEQAAPFQEEPFTPPQGGPQGAPGVGDQQAPAVGADPQILDALADALRDQGATRPAAEALDRGDLPGAAESLRELADRASQLSPEARGDLADRLREAANQVQGRNQALADQLRESATGLELGGQSAGDALEDLAAAVESLQPNQPPGEGAGQGEQGENQGQGEQSQEAAPGDTPGDTQGEQAQGEQAQGQGQGEQAQGQGQGQGAGAGNSDAAGEQRQSPQSGRLGVAGEPLQLEAQGQGQDAERRDDQPPASAEVVPGRTSGGGGGAQGTTGADPLRVPVDERDVVQEYFTP